MIKDEKTTTNDQSDDKTYTTKILKNEESSAETCFNSLFEDENQYKPEIRKEQRNSKPLKIQTADTDIQLNKQNKYQKKDIFKVGNDKNVINENKNKIKRRERSLREIQLRNADMLDKTHIHVRQHKHLFKLSCTISNLYYIFANPISEENMKKLEVFYYKKAAVVNKQRIVGYSIFSAECRRNSIYLKKGIGYAEMENELSRIWHEEMSEEQRGMYRKEAHEQNKKKGRYKKLYE